MTYKVTLTYKDDKVLNILTSEENLDNLLDSLDESRVFFDQKTQAGFWTCKKELRHIIVQNYVPEQEVVEEKKEPLVAEDSKDVLPGKEDLTDGEIIASQA